ncbi:hypothetical protein A2865_03610 [Candidatus Woesebacteria bacterium RIFCSPHIGHO2_01_FULL_39_17]|uniref:HD domain protein n=3 Tax=Candidatus Woeseibacteriota TaxID=1752722 RepID=A0A0G0QVE5_9BACT|nr:MAG: HD domain protein [Microgenomates group bacterium GW2011_GWC1_38_12]KKQ93762.1 MAG: HD domain protein [Candidatus Woesebacteria bacterium GW2011_GWB1_39_10b]KKR14325.1 MAG: HD domain protein [Candidatus Woesebacteria bacterium GW2011_GWA1_39_21b]OGM23618.1 MAG: hypothetical protein A2865_03610 [Candidatus Woesebacteria bacterium RIFCSPHIGHO2_01_FULL_39_17]OGM64354.1 MAG: hypothetical protein A3A52_05465 [Candidatus Woesebacteria bacterium RIFCSPLOWO2_01_FULL_39_14]
MNKRDLELLKRIGKEAIILDWEKAFSGKAKGNKHLFRVNKIARFLQKREGGNLFLILASAWVHDVSLAFGGIESEENIKRKTTQFLSKFNLTPIEIKKIAEYCSWHESGKKNIPIEAQIIHDSDVIDKSGMLGFIRHVWKLTNILGGKVLSNKHDLKKVNEHLKVREKKVFTKTAKDIVKKLNIKRDEFFENEKRSIMVMKQISSKAYRGINSDEITLFLINKTNASFREALVEQLGCRYLK